MALSANRASDAGVTITGSTRLVGVLGWPVAHSRSPQMQNAAFAALELDFAYVPLPTPPERVPEAVRGLAALGFAGANATVPHKAAVLAAADTCSPLARALGAANTLVVRPDGTVFADNTDVYGFSADLRAHGIMIGPGTRTLVLGAGGASRAVVYALAAAGATVAVVNRTPDRANELCQLIGVALPDAAARLSAHALHAALPHDLAALVSDAELIVNTTSLGLHDGDPLPWDAAALPVGPGHTAYDLIYRETPFLAHARASGARAIGGLGMLVHQGAQSAALWTGRDVDELARLMQHALEEG
jgi:shikimate dehydrogenase